MPACTKCRGGALRARKLRTLCMARLAPCQSMRHASLFGGSDGKCVLKALFGWPRRAGRMPRYGNPRRANAPEPTNSPSGSQSGAIVHGARNGLTINPTTNGIECMLFAYVVCLYEHGRHTVRGVWHSSVPTPKLSPKRHPVFGNAGRDVKKIIVEAREQPPAHKQTTQRTQNQTHKPTNTHSQTHRRNQHSSSNRLRR